MSQTWILGSPRRARSHDCVPLMRAWQVSDQDPDQRGHKTSACMLQSVQMHAAIASHTTAGIALDWQLRNAKERDVRPLAATLGYRRGDWQS